MPKEKPRVNIGEVIKTYRSQRGFSEGDIERRTGLLRCSYAQKIVRRAEVKGVGDEFLITRLWVSDRVRDSAAATGKR